MMNEQTHLMVLKHTHPDGAEEWVCPECDYFEEAESGDTEEG